MTKKTVLLNLNQPLTEHIFKVGTDQHLILILYATDSITTQVTVQLAGIGAQADIYGIVLACRSQQINLHTLQKHLSPQTRSNLLVKCVLTQQGFFSYEGYITVDKEAQQTDAYQKNQNLMLSPEAKAESKPALEILANNVRCTHSATISKINEEQLFYLESRGIAAKEAKGLIVQGFFENILDQITNSQIKDALCKKIGNLKEYYD